MQLAKTKRAAIYVRVSHSSQVDGTSLEAQEDVCRAYAKREGYKVAKVYCDAGKSAYKDDLHVRPAFTEMIRAAQVLRFDAIIVYKLDRFARKARIYHNERYKLEQVGTKLLSATELVEDSSAGRLSAGMMAQFAEFYSAQLSERIKQSAVSRAARGEWVGPAPFGYKLIGRNLQPADNWLWVVIIFTAYAHGYSSPKIAYALNMANVPQVNGLDWQRDGVLGILSNRAYIGFAGGRALDEYKSNHRALITTELWEVVQAKKAARGGTQIRSKRRQGTPWPVYCAHCDRKMHISPSGSKEYRVDYLRCSGNKSGLCKARGVQLELVNRQAKKLEDSGTTLQALWVAAPRGIMSFN